MGCKVLIFKVCIGESKYQYPPFTCPRMCLHWPVLSANERGQRVAEFQEKIVHANGLDFGVKQWGSPDGTPTLGLHGWLDNAGTYDQLAPQLNALNFCAMDMAGHGLSTHRPPGCHYYITDYISDAIAIADRLSWPSFNLIGHSLGANVSLMLAGAYPDRIKKLVLIEGFGPHTRPAGAAGSQIRSAFAKMKNFDPNLQLIYNTWDEIVEKRMVGGTVVNRQAAESLCRRGTKDVSGGWTWRSDPRLRYASPLRFPEEEICALIAEVTAPTCLILGETGLPPAFMGIETRKKQHKNLSIETLPGQHHLHLEDQSGSVAAVINQFLEE